MTLPRHHTMYVLSDPILQGKKGTIVRAKRMQRSTAAFTLSVSLLSEALLFLPEMLLSPPLDVRERKEGSRKLHLPGSTKPPQHHPQQDPAILASAVAPLNVQHAILEEHIEEPNAIEQ